MRVNYTDNFALWAFVMGSLLMLITLTSLMLQWSCEARGSILNVRHYWSITSGCMFNVNDRWIDADDFRVADVYPQAD